jgi:phosphoribosylpyrophosphate synthetase
MACFQVRSLIIVTLGKALENIKNSELDQVIVTNSIPAKQGEDQI